VHPERSLAAHEAILAAQMEGVFQEVREAWFGARPEPVGGALALREERGELWMHLDAQPDEVDALLAAAAARGACLVRTPFSRPTDLADRLPRRGFRLHQVGETFVWTGEGAGPTGGRRPRVGWPRLRRVADPTIQVIDRGLLPTWTEVCRRAFGQRITPAEALAEKERAWDGMGERARWYLAWVEGIPVATAMLYQSARAAQVLAVGTLPGMRGRGIATALMRRLTADWQAQGSGFLFLDTDPDGQAASLYRTLGFRPVYRREVWIPGPSA
jgi:GNAT superfamily N-acetyltransferase